MTMKKLICGLALALGLSLSCHAQGMKISQYPNTATLTGTNLFIIAAGTTNKNISYEQLSNLLAAAIGGGGGGAQVWTNDSVFTWLSGFPAPDYSGSGTVGPGFQIRTNGSVYSGKDVAIFGTLTGVNTVYSPYFGSCLSSNGQKSAGSHYEILDNLDYGAQALVDINALCDTNEPGCAITMSAYGYGTDSDEMILGVGIPSSTTTYIQMKHNFQVVFKADYSGMVTANATYYPSNAAPIIPTAAALGAGGYWTGNSNGFLVTVYSLDGSTTVMKVLAP